MKLKLIISLLFISLLFGSGGFDHGTSAGKNNLDFSLTWNPFNYFNDGQNYIVFGYGLSNRLDIHGYYSFINKNNANYYFGFLYQFYKSKNLDLSTAIGLRKYINISDTHLFLPQLLYTLHINDKFDVGGSFVNIIDNKSSKGVSIDSFLKYKLYETSKYKVDFTLGAFKPALWKPENREWHPTYSIDFKFKL